MDNKSLKRSTDEKWVLGICGGIAEYVGINPLFIRVATVLAGLTHPFITLAVYFILGMLLPRNEEDPIKASANPFTEEEIIINEG